MNNYILKKEDFIKRIYFIIKLVQNQNRNTMNSSLSSQSDSMGGILDRYINSISDTIVMEKIILDKISSSKKIEVIEDYYYYQPGEDNAGIAPDVLGIKVDNKKIPFVKFDNQWKPIDNMPQIEMKTFKEKDQMISLRNQKYDNEYLVFSDFNLKIDYLLPFFDKSLFTDKIMESLVMDDDVFIVNDQFNRINRVSNITYNDNDIGNIKLLAITKGEDFMKQATLCESGENIIRIKEIKKREKNLKISPIDKLKKYVEKSKRVSSMYSFNKKWRNKNKVNKNTKILDFYTNDLGSINIYRFNKDSVVISSSKEGCYFNKELLEKDTQYNIFFTLLERSSKNKEYFFQKDCLSFLENKQDELLKELEKIVES